MPRNVTAHIVSSEFPADALRVLRLEGSEGLSRLFEFQVEVVTPRLDGPFAASLLGTGVSIAFTADGAPERVISGIVAEASDGLDPASQFRTYRLRVVPRAYRLTQLRYSEKFGEGLESTLKRKLELCDVPFEVHLGTVYEDAVLTFRAQFNETDFDFVNRRCEHFGITYYFVTRSDGDWMVFTDNQQFVDWRRELHIPFVSGGERTNVHRLVAHTKMTPSLYMVADYDYRKPTVDCVGRAELGSGTGGGVIEYGANVKSPGDAAILARMRAEEQLCRQVVFECEGDRSELFPGLRFTLESHPYLGDRELLVTEVEHLIEQPAQNAERGKLAYTNRFRAIPADVPYRPARVTPQPTVPGVVSGIVLAPPEGPATKPWMDENGRYRVQLTSELFQMSPSDQKARSMRMIQATAGQGYGMHFPLRPGTEVMLAFVNGDPDRPIIVGAVPNELTPSPVRGDEPLYNRISTPSGVVMEFEDSD